VRAASVRVPRIRRLRGGASTGLFGGHRSLSSALSTLTSLECQRSRVLPLPCGWQLTLPSLEG
jgi:hypothetical protein